MKKYSDAELEAILKELNDKLSAESISEIQKQEAEDLESSIPNEDITSDNAWGWARIQTEEVNVNKFGPALRSVARASAAEDRKKAASTKKNNSIERKRRKQEIINEAINSKDIDLNASLSVDNKKLLISLLTKNYSERMEWHDKFINSVIESALKKAIPNDLLNAYATFPDAVVPFPGFIYNASKEYGEGLQFKVTPKIPLYFKPEDCNHILKELLPASRQSTLDKAVVFFYKYKDARSKREIKIAEALTKILTFFQLVKHDAFWYEMLVNELKK